MAGTRFIPPTWKFDADLLPETDDAYDIGSSSKKVKDFYMNGELYIGNEKALERTTGDTLRLGMDDLVPALPELSTVQIGGLTGANGMMVYDSTLNSIKDMIAAAFFQRAYIDKAQTFTLHQGLRSVGLDVEQTFSDGDTTPSIAGYTAFTENYSNPANITNLDDGIEGQEIEIRGQSGNVTFIHGTNIFTLSGAHINLAANKTIRFRHRSTKWYQIGGQSN